MPAVASAPAPRKDASSTPSRAVTPRSRCECEGRFLTNSDKGCRAHDVADEFPVAPAEVGSERLTADHGGAPEPARDAGDRGSVVHVDRPRGGQVAAAGDHDAVGIRDRLDHLPGRVVRGQFPFAGGGCQDRGEATLRILPVESAEPDPRHGTHPVPPRRLGRGGGHRDDLGPAVHQLLGEGFEHRLIADVHHVVDDADVTDDNDSHPAPYHLDCSSR